MDECKQFRTLKERGEYVELRLMVQAILHGFQVSRPWGDSSSYDVGLESGSRILRVQVKSTAYRIGTGYLCQFARRKARYSVEQIEFFAAYVIPEDVWYLIPSRILLGVSGQQDVMICPMQPHRKPYYKFECYREAWELLRRD
ncbi:MAG: group I intron-associated PD-(D/E)XK endonuclease [Terriglobales bacterium]